MWGEAFGFLGVPVTQRAIDDLIAPLCIGKDAARVAPLMHELQEKLQVFRGGPLTLALSAVDIALWDIVGKAAGAPLHRLLGGGVADLPCHASLDSFQTLRSFAPACGRRSTLDSRAQNCTRRNFRQCALPAKRQSPTWRSCSM